MTHGFFGFHPRSPTSRPSGTNTQGKRYSKSFGFSHRMGKKFLPCRTEKIYFSSRYSHIHFKKNHVADTCFFHRFQIGCHFLPRKISIHKIPIHTGTDGIRWVCKRLFYLIQRKVFIVFLFI